MISKMGWGATNFEALTQDSEKLLFPCFCSGEGRTVVVIAVSWGQDGWED